MDITEMLNTLKQERAQLQEAIVVLERIAAGQGKCRGRPPKWMVEMKAKPRRGRPPKSEAA